MREFNGNYFYRINKAVARKMYKAGKRVYMIACKLSPESTMWCYPVLSPQNIYYSTLDVAFERYVDEFAYYNCNPETGLYVSFYAPQED